MPEPGETYPDDPDALRDMLEEDGLATTCPRCKGSGLEIDGPDADPDGPADRACSRCES